MAKNLKISAFISFLVTAVSAICYRSTCNEILLSLAITFGTIAYHLVMRLTVGFVFDSVMNNKADYTKWRYRVGNSEMRLYQRLNVKKWKGRVPTYDESLFDSEKHSWEEILGAMCQAELVHETIMILSFLPIIAGVWFGDFPVFIITSIVAAMVDMTFVIIQRYNRQRVMCMLSRKRK